jgi:metallo-beta-lactamase family protein
VEQLDGLSAHADQHELLDWMSELREAPKQVFVVHGENQAADDMRLKIEEIYRYPTVVPKLYDIVELDL